jgi:hypothetical protein
MVSLEDEVCSDQEEMDRAMLGDAWVCAQEWDEHERPY